MYVCIDTHYGYNHANLVAQHFHAICMHVHISSIYIHIHISYTCIAVAPIYMWYLVSVYDSISTPCNAGMDVVG